MQSTPINAVYPLSVSENDIIRTCIGISASRTKQDNKKIDVITSAIRSLHSSSRRTGQHSVAFVILNFTRFRAVNSFLL